MRDIPSEIFRVRRTPTDKPPGTVATIRRCIGKILERGLELSRTPSETLTAQLALTVLTFNRDHVQLNKRHRYRRDTCK